MRKPILGKDQDKLDWRESLDRLASALEGHNHPNCIDRDTPRYCAGLYWTLWHCHKYGVSETAIRDIWPDFPGWPAWGHQTEMESKAMDLTVRTWEEEDFLQFAESASTPEGRQKWLARLIPAEHMPTDPERLAKLDKAMQGVASRARDGAEKITVMRAAALEGLSRGPHEHPDHLPVCPICGHRWAFVRTWSDGSKSYTSAAVVTRMEVLGYGTANWLPVEHEI